MNSNRRNKLIFFQVTTPGSDDAAMQEQAVGGLKTVAASVKLFADRVTELTPTSLDVDRISPFVMDSFYAAAANFAWLVRESGEESYQIGLDTIRHCLRRLGTQNLSTQKISPPLDLVWSIVDETYSRDI
jgi:hypothetical protein